MFGFLKSKPTHVDPSLLQKSQDGSVAISSISVPKYRVKGNYVEYVVECTRMNRTWQVYRRYQQFKALHGQLTSLCGMGTAHHCELGVVPVLCASSWTEVTNQSPELVERRRRFLQVYLQQLLVPTNLFYVAKTALYSFLHDGEVTVVYKSRAQIPLLGITAVAEADRIAAEEEEGQEPATGQILSSTSAKLKSPEEVVAASIPDFAATGPSKTVGGGDKKQPPSKHTRQEVFPKGASESDLQGHDGASEKCTNCGEETGIDYELDMWEEYGRCNQCGRYGLHELILPAEHEGEGLKGSPAGHHMDPHQEQYRDSEDKKDKEEDEDAKYEKMLADSICSKPEEVETEEYDDGKLRARPKLAGSGTPEMKSETATFDEENKEEEKGKQQHTTQTGKNPPQQQQSPRVDTSPGSPQSLAVSSPGASSQSPSTHAGSFPPSGVRMSDRLSLDSAQIIPDDFELITTLGRGTFGKVMKVKHRRSGEVFAMKVLSKSTIYKRRMIEYIKEEKQIMSLLPQHPFICYLHFAFQTLEHVYLIMDYLPGGELYAHIYPHKSLREQEARFYMAECVLALEHLHKYDVVHRDIKPENIVLDREGHVKLTDFGLARKDFSRTRRRSFVGSAEYLAPETIQGDVQTKALDWWSLGVMLYEMLSGAAPFHAPTNNDVYQAVLHKTLDFNKPCFSKPAQNLLAQMLEKDPQKRLSNPSLIKKHPFFAGLDWDAMLRCEVKAPFVPDLGVNDTKYFHKDFTSEWATIPESQGSSRQTLEILSRRFSNFVFTKVTPPQRASQTQSPPLSPPLGATGTLRQRSMDDTLGMSSPDASYMVHDIPNLVNPELFTGVWRLLTVEWLSDDHKIAFPWGSEVVGMLIYCSNGLFAMQIAPIKRRKFRQGSAERISKEEMGEAYCSYGAQFGHYEVHPGRSYITHHNTSSLCPNLGSAAQRKYFEFAEGGKQLTLTGTRVELADAIHARFRLTWERSTDRSDLERK